MSSTVRPAAVSSRNGGAASPAASAKATAGIANNGNLVPDDIPDDVLERLGLSRRPEVWKRFGWQEGFETYRWFHKEDKDGPFAAFDAWLAGRRAASVRARR